MGNSLQLKNGRKPRIYKGFTSSVHHTSVVTIGSTDIRNNRLTAFLQRAVSTVVLIASGVPALAQLPTLGDGSDMTSSVERRLGDRIAREIYRDPDYLDDPVLLEYLQGIWQPLLAAARTRGEISPELDERFAWEIMLARDRSVNAFALPGGYLGVHLGLIAVVGSRDELASVLGHELSHVTQRHISRLTSKQGQQTPWMLGAMILGVLAASKSVDAANALMVGGQAISAQNQLNFSRDMEREADRVGYGVMTLAGFDGAGFTSMFDKLQQASRLNDNGAYPYLRSHPLTTERIADMHARQPQTITGAEVVVTSPEHAMMAARARVLASPGVEPLGELLAEAQDARLATMSIPRQVGILYGAALAASRQRNFAVAAGFLGRLAPLVREPAGAARQFGLLQAEVALAAGQAPQAMALLRGAPQSRSDMAESSVSSRPELVLGAQAAIMGRQDAELAKATQMLQTRVATHPRDALAWQLLATAYGVQGQTMRAIRADAEVRVAALDYAAALDRFKAAQQLVRQTGAAQGAADHIEASILDTRRRQIESLLKEQALDR